MQVNTNDPDVRRLVTLIADTVVAHGGYVHPDLIVRHEGPSLSLSLPREANLHADENLDRPHPEAPPLLIIPAELHIPVTDLDWEASREHLAYTGDSSHLSTPQQEILDAMVDLFNAVDKVRVIGQAYALHSLAGDPELAGLIATGRPRWKASSDEPGSPAHTVMRSRLRQEMGDGEEGPMGFFMPMIDMLNHHPYGSRYERTQEGAWLIRVHHPTPTEQVFVRYNKADALGVALSLGYFEPNTRFVAAAAGDFELEPLGRIRIEGVGVSRRRLPAPTIGRTADGLSIAGLELARDMLPRLNLLLSMPIRSLHPQLPDPEVSRLVAAVVNGAIAHTTGFYRNLAQLTHGSDDPLRRLFHQVARHQLGVLAGLRDD